MPPKRPSPSDDESRKRSRKRPTTTPSALPSEFITTLGPNDVLMGRGALSTDFEGNTRLRLLVQQRFEEYSRVSTRKDKSQIAREIIQQVRSRGGRFLQSAETLKDIDPSKLPHNKAAWYAVYDEAVLIAKIKQMMLDFPRRRQAGTSRQGSIPTDTKPRAAPGGLANLPRAQPFPVGVNNPFAAMNPHPIGLQPPLQSMVVPSSVAYRPQPSASDQSRTIHSLQQMLIQVIGMLLQQHINSANNMPTSGMSPDLAQILTTLSRLPLANPPSGMAATSGGLLPTHLGSSGGTDNLRITSSSLIASPSAATGASGGTPTPSALEQALLQYLSTQAMPRSLPNTQDQQARAWLQYLLQLQRMGAHPTTSTHHALEARQLGPVPPNHRTSAPASSQTIETATDSTSNTQRLSEVAHASARSETTTIPPQEQALGRQEPATQNPSGQQRTQQPHAVVTSTDRESVESGLALLLWALQNGNNSQRRRAP